MVSRLVSTLEQSTVLTKFLNIASKWNKTGGQKNVSLDLYKNRYFTEIPQTLLNFFGQSLFTVDVTNYVSSSNFGDFEKLSDILSSILFSYLKLVRKNHPLPQILTHSFFRPKSCITSNSLPENSLICNKGTSLGV